MKMRERITFNFGANVRPRKPKTTPKSKKSGGAGRKAGGSKFGS